MAACGYQMAYKHLQKILLLALLCWPCTRVCGEDSFEDVFIDPLESEEVQFGGDYYDYPDHGDNPEIEDSDLSVEVIDIPTKIHEVTVFCGTDQMDIILLVPRIDDISVIGLGGLELLSDVRQHCGFEIKQGRHQILLSIPFRGCHVEYKQGSYIIRLVYPSQDGTKGVATVSCEGTSPDREEEDDDDDDSSLEALKSGMPNNDFWPHNSETFPPLVENVTTIPVLWNKGCHVPKSQRISCGPDCGPECKHKGCCVDRQTDTCYYPMDECTADKHFVFVVYFNTSSFPLAPNTDVRVGQGKCRPVLKTADFAVFKFRISDCGTRTYEVGGSVIYLAEVQAAVKVYNLKYGIITRENPYRLLVECRYPKYGRFESSSLATVGYMVMIPSLPPVLSSPGLYGVQLRLAKDATFTTFYPQYHIPLRELLGQLVYLELRLINPNTTAVLVVNYCLAYPRSATKALILLFEGCPNPLDDSSADILYMDDLPQDKYRRRFAIRTFQFMDVRLNKYLNEEIYFMCSTEVCQPAEKTCNEGCFVG